MPSEAVSYSLSFFFPVCTAISAGLSFFSLSLLIGYIIKAKEVFERLSSFKKQAAVVSTGLLRDFQYFKTKNSAYCYVKLVFVADKQCVIVPGIEFANESEYNEWKARAEMNESGDAIVQNVSVSYLPNDLKTCEMTERLEKAIGSYNSADEYGTSLLLEHQSWLIGWSMGCLLLALMISIIFNPIGLAIGAVAIGYVAGSLLGYCMCRPVWRLPLSLAPDGDSRRGATIIDYDGDETPQCMSKNNTQIGCMIQLRPFFE